MGNDVEDFKLLSRLELAVVCDELHCVCARNMDNH